MSTNTGFKLLRPLFSMIRVVAQVIVLLVIGFSQLNFAQQAKPMSFASANQAVQALYQALTANDEGAVAAILGAGPELTSSGDAVIDKLEREQFAHKYQEMHRLVREPDGNTVLYIGA